MASRSYQPPASFIDPAGSWPEGPFQSGTPPYAKVTAAIVRTAQYVMTTRGLSLRAVARPAGIDPTSLSRLLSGKVVPDVATVANLERELNVDLWPGRIS